jgi:hypothetical protein
MLAAFDKFSQIVRPSPLRNRILHLRWNTPSVDKLGRRIIPGKWAASGSCLQEHQCLTNRRRSIGSDNARSGDDRFIHCYQRVPCRSLSTLPLEQSSVISTSTLPGICTRLISFCSMSTLHGAWTDIRRQIRVGSPDRIGCKIQKNGRQLRGEN